MSGPSLRRGSRGRPTKLTRLISILWKKAKCKECSVSVARMDFEKIMGKFTKVKIQYTNSSPTKEQSSPVKSKAEPSPVVNSRLKSNENGMVLIHRNAYKPHPVKSKAATTTKKQTLKIASPDTVTKSTPRKTYSKENKKIVKKNNKHYGIKFLTPTAKFDGDDLNNNGALVELLPHINNNILPSNEWTIDVLTDENEPEKDHIYDRIAAELEDLMYNEKIPTGTSKDGNSDSKTDDFPTIMDILNDNLPSKSEKQSNPEKNNEEMDTSSIEALLSDKVNEPMDTSQGEEPMENKKVEVTSDENIDPTAVLDEALKKAVAEQLPDDSKPDEDNTINEPPEKIVLNGPDKPTDNSSQLTESEKTDIVKKPFEPEKSEGKTVQFLVFKQIKNNECCRLVKCFKNLRYNVEIEGRYVELIAAPKYISTIDDAKVLLQIVNDSNLNSFNVVQ